MAKIGTIEGFIGKYIYFCNIAANVIASFALHFRSSGSRVIPSGPEHSGVLIGHTGKIPLEDGLFANRPSPAPRSAGRFSLARSEKLILCSYAGQLNRLVIHKSRLLRSFIARSVAYPGIVITISSGSHFHHMTRSETSIQSANLTGCC